MIVDPNETRLEELLNKVAAEPSVELQGRALEAARTSQVKRRHGSRTFIWAAVGACALALFAFVGVRRASASNILLRISTSVEEAKTAHMVGYTIRGGKRIQSREIWYDRGLWRAQEKSKLIIYRPGMRWDYNEKTHQALVTSHTKGNPFNSDPTAFNLNQILRSMDRFMFVSEAVPLGKDDKGRPVTRVTLDNRLHSGDRVQLWVDTDTDLPFEFVTVQNHGGNWVRTNDVLLEYNMPLDPRLFEPVVPAGTAILNLDQLHDKWQQKLSVTVAEGKLLDSIVKVRDVWAGPEGDVVVLFTGDGSQPGFSASLVDSTGLEYARLEDFHPSLFASWMIQARPITIDGEKLRGFWWVPTRPTGHWAPRSYKMTIFADRTAENYRAPNPRASLALKLSAKAQDQEMFPEYNVIFGSTPKDEDTLRWRRPSALARFYRYHWLDSRGRPIKLKPEDNDALLDQVFEYQTAPVKTATLDRASAEKALAYETTVAKLMEKWSESAEQSAPGLFWRDVYITLKDLGRDAEADRVLRHASELDPELKIDETAPKEWERIQSNRRLGFSPRLPSPSYVKRTTEQGY